MYNSKNIVHHFYTSQKGIDLTNKNRLYDKDNLWLVNENDINQIPCEMYVQYSKKTLFQVVYR